MIKIGVLTSSRADLGVYLPLLHKIKQDSDLQLGIIAFGSHLSHFYGYTINEIFSEGFEVKYKIPSILCSDNEESVSSSAALTGLKFSSFWAEHRKEFDLILCLGDRFEMFSAVLAGVPFGIRFVHFYGGDETSGSIDNIYRDCISHASFLHFASTKKCADRIAVLKGNNRNIEVVGILSLTGFETMKLLTVEEFLLKWGVDLNLPTVLLSIHPETIIFSGNKNNAKIIEQVIDLIHREFQVLITMPNSDTNGSEFRNIFHVCKGKYPKEVFLFENLGTTAYFTCMKYCRFILGNTSSGISEAPSFNKYFINIGDRQSGREKNPNVYDAPFNLNAISATINKVKKQGDYNGGNLYFKGNTTSNIISRLKSFSDGKL